MEPKSPLCIDLNIVNFHKVLATVLEVESREKLTGKLNGAEGTLEM